MVEFNHTDYTTAKGVLVFPDHYVSVAHTFKKDDAAAVTQDGRKIVKAGTLYPSNDSSAIGIVWADYDVTDGEILIDGVNVKEYKQEFLNNKIKLFKTTF